MSSFQNGRDKEKSHPVDTGWLFFSLSCSRGFSSLHKLSFIYKLRKLSSRIVTMWCLQVRTIGPCFLQVSECPSEALVFNWTVQQRYYEKTLEFLSYAICSLVDCCIASKANKIPFPSTVKTYGQHCDSTLTVSIYQASHWWPSDTTDHINSTNIFSV